MDAVAAEQDNLANKLNLAKSVEGVQKCIDELIKARDAIAAGR